jgi:hypothetical protein
MRTSPQASSRRSIAALVLVAVVAAATVASPAFAADDHAGGHPLIVSQPAPASPRGHGTPPDDPGRGMVWAGLASGQAACAHELMVVGTATTMCSHGPDQAPDDVNVQERPSTVELAGTVSGGSVATAGSVPCYGDGVTGPRVQAVYAHAADVPSRYADVVGLIGGWTGAVDNIYRDSAAETGGTRHIRWVTDPSCNLSVLDVQLSISGDDDYAAMVNELSSLGLNRTDRHYIVWADATVYCGIGGFVEDDRAASNNGNNGGPAYARVDSACWGKTNAVEAHEIMHTLGGVQYSAPHTSGGGHCTDDYDRMCYAESSAVTMTYSCPASHERLFDCGHDDYFHTAPPAGSYLAGHWNAANSVFLEMVDPGAPSSTSTTSTSTTTPASTNVTESWSGSLSRKSPSRTYSFASGGGSVSPSLRFTSSPSLTLVLRSSDGTVVAQGQGPSVLQLSAAAAAGSYTVTVSGTGASAKFTLTVVHPSS